MLKGKVPAVGVTTTLANGQVDPNTVVIPVGTTFTANSVAAGGVAFDAVGGVTTTLTVTEDGFALTNPPSGNAVNQVDIVDVASSHLTLPCDRIC